MKWRFLNETVAKIELKRSKKPSKMGRSIPFSQVQKGCGVAASDYRLRLQITCSLYETIQSSALPFVTLLILCGQGDDFVGYDFG